MIFGDGEVVGARLDRLGLRPLRSIETDEYLCAMSEAGQIDFPSAKVVARGRVESGGTLYYDHNRGRSFNTMETLEDLASRKDYRALLEAARINLDDLPVPTATEAALDDSLNPYQRLSPTASIRKPEAAHGPHVAKRGEGLGHGLWVRHQRAVGRRRRDGEVFQPAVCAGDQPAA